MSSALYDASRSTFKALRFSLTLSYETPIFDVIKAQI